MGDNRIGMPETWKGAVPFKNQVGGPRHQTVDEYRALDRAYRDVLRELGWKL